ncbi:hypothetical protein B9Z19DRAFT_1120427 [Tuber borchii]|uniref:Uncharacterized protein n=1 Tax=Tuber borchii TaxID=42251 RepID=A0A2T7A4K4_TUBBO|nr:hypothetical protein B9Z19DRAFT_1120427 [Tuber borchii]
MPERLGQTPTDVIIKGISGITTVSLDSATPNTATGLPLAFPPIPIDVTTLAFTKFIADFIAFQKTKDYDIVTRAPELLASVALRPNFSDLTGSFRLYKRKVLETVISQTESKGYTFKMGMMIRVRGLGYSVAEVAISVVDRTSGDSELGGNDIVEYAKGASNL